MHVACQKENEIVEMENSGLHLRMMNQTNVELDSIVSNDHNFGSLLSGDSTDYFEFDLIHAYPEVSLTFNEEIYFWSSPIDNIGFWLETHESGNYTLKITGLTSSYLVEAHLIED